MTGAVRERVFKMQWIPRGLRSAVIARRPMPGRGSQMGGRRPIRRLQLIGLTCVLLGASSCGGAQGQQQETLHVGVFGGTWQQAVRESVAKRFHQETGARIVTTAGSDAEFLSALRASRGGNPPYDVLVLHPYTAATAAGQGLIETVDTKRLSEWENVNNRLTKQTVFDGKQYGVPFVVGQLGLVYRTDKTKVPPRSWKDIFLPQYKGCVGLQPPGTPESGPKVFTALTKANGGGVENQVAVDKAFKWLAAHKEWVHSFPATAAQTQTLLERGDVCVAPEWDARAVQMRSDGVPVKIVYPKGDVVAGPNSFVVAKGSEHRGLAYKFLEVAIDPKVQAKFNEVEPYALSNEDTQYRHEYVRNLRNGKVDFDSLVFPNNSAIRKSSDDWQKRWEGVFGS